MFLGSFLGYMRPLRMGEPYLGVRFSDAITIINFKPPTYEIDIYDMHEDSRQFHVNVYLGFAKYIKDLDLARYIITA